MLNFVYHNPVKVVFGRGTIAKLVNLVKMDQTIMMTYGGGSIRQNGVYDQVMDALKGHSVVEFSGIEPNPRYETCMEAVKKAKIEGVDFLLSVGGGSVLDATKFIAAAIRYEGNDPWDILGERAPVTSAVPIGCVITLPATGSEMNSIAVISRESTREKLPFSSKHVYPQFSILDPETTYSLPERQITNGIVDTFVHVLEQYLTYDANTPLQDRQAEAILLTLIEEAPKVLEDPNNYDVRANLVWCATHGLNGLIACGVPQDWSTHMIGHELTALHGLDHGQSLAIVLPAVLQHQKQQKGPKLVQYAQRVWKIKGLGHDETIDAAITQTVEFFRSVGMPTRLSDYNITPSDCMTVAERFEQRGVKLGEHRAIGKQEIEEILALCA
ncbi:MAG: iron-containing alcohol dehydrogenase [Syntrophales bacterium]|nr:iron-containing alcohol dehydrogenase [Syntrophales bacterium]